MDGTGITIEIVAVAGVASVLLMAVKSNIDLLCDVFVSIGRARKTWRDMWKADDEATEPEDEPEPPTPPAGAEEPPQVLPPRTRDRRSRRAEEPDDRNDEEPPMAA
ncbi:hypothetical protein GCM10010451_32790 [Streptomyces virens]|uniref:Uncharacterized protein n=1 Tax=Streptomyces virens TaxID=285572 RepID=A0ABP6PQJ9_9ACTN|nr:MULTISPECIES: hypothetical protein [Streptomyces]MBA8975018.1 hypothetical protein [Streptomyces calvus]